MRPPSRVTDLPCSSGAAGELCAPLHVQLMDVAAAALAAPSVGKRSPLVGPAIQMARLLQAAASKEGHAPGDGPNKELCARLEGDERWAAFLAAGSGGGAADDDGAAAPRLAPLCGEQEGDLCGPRVKPLPLDGAGGEGGEGEGGDLGGISGAELYALLSKMSVLG